MTASPQSDPQAERLLKALEQQSNLSCEEAQAQLPALVEAELSGADADDLPQFAALLRHLDTCEADCVALYADLSEKLVELAGLALVVASPQTAEMPKTAEMPIFEKVRESVFATVLMLRDVASRFRMQLNLPPFASPQMELVLSANTLLFDGDLSEVAHLPQVTVSLTGDDKEPDLTVVVQTFDAPTRWEVQLTAGATTRSAATDETGMARFDAIPSTDLRLPVLDVVLLDDGPRSGDADPSV